MIRNHLQAVTSVEWRLVGSLVCSPEELKVQLKDVASGYELTGHWMVIVSCFKAPRTVICCFVQ